MWFIRWVLFLPNLTLGLKEKLPPLQALFWKKVLIEMLLIILKTELLRTKMEKLHYPHIKLFFLKLP